MALEVNQLFDDYLRLTEQQKADFENLLIGSKPVPDWQKDEVTRRLNAILKDKNRLISRQKAFKRLGWE